MHKLHATLVTAALPLVLPSLKKMVKVLDALEFIDEVKIGQATFKVWQAEDKSQARMIKTKGFGRVWNKQENRAVIQLLKKVADMVLGDDGIKVKSIVKTSTKKLSGYVCTFVFDKAIFYVIIEAKA